MEDLPCIDIEGKQLAYTNKEVNKLTDTEGCHLSVITNKVYSLEDEQFISDDDENTCHLTEDVADSKAERVKREYFSVLLQMDRVGQRPKIKNDQLDGGSKLRNQIQEIIDTEGADSSISKLYKDLGNFDENIKSDAKFVEISGTGVYKNRLIIGEQVPIEEDSFVVFNFALWREGMDEPFDSTWNRQKPAAVNLKIDPLLPGLYELLLTMKRGEWCEAYIKPEAAFGQLGAMPRIPPNATLFCLIQIINVVAKEKIPFNFNNDLDDDGRILDFKSIRQMSEEARKQGNFYREKNNLKAALSRYFSGVRMLEGFTYKDELEESQGKEVLIHLFNNIASTANKAGYPRMALKACKEAIDLNGGNEKTYYNKMIAWKKKGHTDRALMVARRAMQLFVNDTKKVKVFRDEADKLKRLMAQEQSDTNKLYRLMGSAYSAPKITLNART